MYGQGEVVYRLVSIHSTSFAKWSSADDCVREEEEKTRKRERKHTSAQTARPPEFCVFTRLESRGTHKGGEAFVHLLALNLYQQTRTGACNKLGREAAFGSFCIRMYE